MTVTRAAAGFKISQARRLGFEMYLKSGVRRLDVTREEHFSFGIVLRNRSDAALHLRDFRVLSSPSLSMSVSADDALLEANSSLELRLAGVAARVGYSAVHGISLRVVHPSGAFETPLIFINPIQIIVVPAPLRRVARPSLGGLSRRPSDAERTGHMSGDFSRVSRVARPPVGRRLAQNCLEGLGQARHLVGSRRRADGAPINLAAAGRFDGTVGGRDGKGHHLTRDWIASLQY